MSKNKKSIFHSLFSIFLPLASILFPLTCLYAEDVRLSTYYPSPFGNYRQIQIQEDSRVLMTDFTNSVAMAGINIISSFTANNFTPGIFWSTRDNNAALPKAGIWMQEGATASTLFFGTSNAYATGINAAAQLMALDGNGNLGIGTAAPATKIQAVTTDGTLAATTDILKLQHSSTGAPANAFGTGLLFAGESATVDNRDMARIQSTWTTAADATRASNLQFQTLTAAGALTNQMTIDGAGNVGIGTAAPTTRIQGTTNDAVTAAVTDVLRLHHSSTGVPANFFGTGLLFSGESNTTDNRDMARIRSTWTTATDGTRASNLQFQTLTNGGALANYMTLDGEGLLGLIGPGAVARALIATVENALEISRSANRIVTLRVANALQVGGTSAASRVLVQSESVNTPLSIAMDSYSDSFDPATMGADAPGNTAFVTLATLGNLGGAARGNMFFASRGPNQRIAFYTGSAFMTAANERMRIESNGNVGIGGIVPAQRLSVNGTAGKLVAGAWVGLSDERVKKDISPYTDGLGLIDRIEPVRFKFNGLGPYTSDGKEHVGVIGQKIKEVAPYMIENLNAKLHPEDTVDTELLQFDPSALTYALINAVKELKAENDVLKARVEALEKK